MTIEWKMSIGIVLSVTIISYDSFSQENKSLLEQKIENIAEVNEAEDIDYTYLLESLQHYREQPINLNNTSREELSELHLLNDLQINNLLFHIERNGNLISVYELQSIDGFDLNTIRKILPFVKVNNGVDIPHYTFKEMLANGNHQVIVRYQQVLQEQKGFAETDTTQEESHAHYIGSPAKLYTRYRFKYGNKVSWGITGEKDAGEEFFKGSQKKGFDFYSAHLFISQKKYIKELALGDYQVTFGQGLTAWSGFGFGKSPDAMGIKKTATGIRPYTSVNENLFLRGVAAKAEYKGFSFTSFFSSKRIDANINLTDSLTGEVLEIQSLLINGLHTTPSEIENKNAIIQRIVGGNLSFKRKKFSVGVTGITSDLSTEIAPKSRLYNQFSLAQKKSTNIGADYNLIFRNVNFFGEISKSLNGGVSYLNSVLISVDPKLAFSVLQRNYQRNFQPIFSSGFGENYLNANEKGIYAGFLFKPFNTLSISGYYDQFKFPWLKYRVNAPSHGADHLAQITFTPDKKSELYLRFRLQKKSGNANDEAEEIKYLETVNKKSYRINYSYTITPSIKARSRFEFSSYKPESSKEQKGYLLYQDFIYNSISSPVSVTLRYSLFHTDDYNTRIYTYENDVLGAYSIPAFYDKGSKWYILLNYSVTRNLDLWLRYSHLTYIHKEVISEGTLNEINGNVKSEMKLQAVFKL